MVHLSLGELVSSSDIKGGVRKPTAPSPQKGPEAWPGARSEGGLPAQTACLVGKAPGLPPAVKQQTDPTQDQVPGHTHFWMQCCKGKNSGDERRSQVR